MNFLLPPWWLIHVAVAAVWLYEGLWAKLLGREPNQARVVGAVPQLGARFGGSFLQMLGIVEVVLALWVLSRLAPVVCALAQTVLLVALNTCGLLFARGLIHDPPGMLVKNFAFLVLVWVSASSPDWQ
jgi:hypothetical protein